MEIIRFIESEWAVVSGAPFAVLILALSIWVVVHYLYKARLDSAKELLELTQRRLADIQKRTGAESPEDVSDRLNRIEAELKKLGETDFVSVFEGEFKISDLPKLPR